MAQLYKKIVASFCGIDIILFDKEMWVGGGGGLVSSRSVTWDLVAPNVVIALQLTRSILNEKKPKFVKVNIIIH